MKMLLRYCYYIILAEIFSVHCYGPSVMVSRTRVKMMIVIVPYWVDTNSGSSSVLLSDVRIFKGFFVSCLTRHTSQWQCHYQTFDG